ncbi:dihydrolipoyl dehydrogenase [Psychromonas hadalis]|uniref:dihydrolipoyl dehydrogenase n=1 Tax=Psychromonas hadalis TaxID=211669 RepID=UPI0003B7474D|nr:dihydrolipoyl dehydrogenase [Psychromonas hadalis]
MKFDLIIEEFSGHDKTGVIGKMNVKEGSEINSGDLLFIVESSKGTVKFTSNYKGILEKLIISEGDSVNKNQVIGIVDGECTSPKSCNISATNPIEKSALKKYSFGVSKPAKKEYEKDVVIVGGGPGGYVAAIRAAQNGKSVLLIEKDKLGGTCLNYGCIPTKSIISSVNLYENVKRASEFGLEITDVKISLEKIRERTVGVVNNLVSGVEHLMKHNRIKVIIGTAEVCDQNTLSIKNKKLDAKIKFKNLIIATGSSPSMLPIEGADDSILTSKELLELTEIPASLTIIGGGIIGMEFAFIFNSLGCKVNVIEFFPTILNDMDQDIVTVIRESAIEKGIKLYENSCAQVIKTSVDGSKIVNFKTADKHNLVISEKVAIAVGRTANIDSLDLEKLNVKLNEKENGIDVNNSMQTSNEKIYAIGDVTNIIQLAHVASHQGIVAADHIAGIDAQMQYDNIPSAIFTFPEAASTGLTEKQCIDKNIPYKVGKFPMVANGKAQAMGETEGFVKIISNPDSGVVIGGGLVGIHATDLLSVVTNLIAAKTTVKEAVHVIYAHPTTSEAVHEALLSVEGKGIHYG